MISASSKGKSTSMYHQCTETLWLKYCNSHSILNTFFSYGNTLPMHRIAHSKYGGIFQPTMTQVIRLLSDPHATSSAPSQGNLTDLTTLPPTPTSLSSLPPSDPFSSSQLTYTTNGLDSFPAPSFYPSRRHSWIHVFPEGKIHQHPDKIMRYFKWGVARMILESEPCPDVLAMWIDGPQIVMANERTFPRPLPRPGNDVSITFGERMDVEAVFGPFRERWRELVRRAEVKRSRLGDAMKPAEYPGNRQLGEVHDQELRYGAEAEQLRKEVTLAVRNEVLKVRRSTGLPDEDPKCSRVETWREEGSVDKGEGNMKDGSVVEDM
jgi:monolysocardiolipin acyltransferase